MTDFLLYTPVGWVCLVLLAALGLLFYHLTMFAGFLGLGKLIDGVAGKYLVNLAISHDQRLNALTGGDPDSTVSARLGRAYCWAIVESKKGLFFWLFVLPASKLLHRLDPYHVEKYALSDRSEGKKAIFGYKKLAKRHWDWLEARKALAAG